MKIRLSILAWGIKFVVLWLLCTYLLTPVNLKAGDDWDTTADLAVCFNHLGYQKVGKQAEALLQPHMRVLVVYYVQTHDKSGVPVTDASDPKATGFLVCVDVENATKAKEMLREAIKNG